MAQNITLLGASYSNCPAVLLPKTGGGTARFDDASVTTAAAEDVASGKIFLAADGTITTGTGTGGGGGSVTQDANGYIVLPSTGGGGGGATQHTIHLEFSDSTDTDIDVYYDDSLLGTMITAYNPSTWTYSTKTVTLAQLDGTTWYDKQSIPIGVELIDYDACLDDYAIDSSGNAVAQQWYVASDYTAIENGMTFSFKGCRWFYLAYYDSTQAVISAVNIDSISTPDPNDSNVGVGTLSSGIPANAKYIRITGTGAMSSRLSLIRTA